MRSASKASRCLQNTPGQIWGGPGGHRKFEEIPQHPRRPGLFFLHLDPSTWSSSGPGPSVPAPTTPAGHWNWRLASLPTGFSSSSASFLSSSSPWPPSPLLSHPSSIHPLVHPSPISPSVPVRPPTHPSWVHPSFRPASVFE